MRRNTRYALWVLLAVLYAGCEIATRVDPSLVDAGSSDDGGTDDGGTDDGGTE